MGKDEKSSPTSSFGAAAVAYAGHRPDYARAAARWALKAAPGTRVLGPDAGTGKVRHGGRRSGDRPGPRARRHPGGLWNTMDDGVA
nr:MULTISPECIES: hypothetical protein [Streptomyces]